MHVHKEKPACWTEERKAVAPGFKESGLWCYQTPDGLRLTPGCAGCARMKGEADDVSGTL